MTRKAATELIILAAPWLFLLLWCVTSYCREQSDSIRRGSCLYVAYSVVYRNHAGTNYAIVFIRSNLSGGLQFYTCHQFVTDDDPTRRSDSCYVIVFSGAAGNRSDCAVGVERAHGAAGLGRNGGCCVRCMVGESNWAYKVSSNRTIPIK